MTCVRTFAAPFALVIGLTLTTVARAGDRMPIQGRGSFTTTSDTELPG
jgi:hypothetical protein